MEPYLIADSTVGIIAQRLVRRLCPKCKRQRMITDEDKRRLRIRGEGTQPIYEPADRVVHSVMVPVTADELVYMRL